MDFSRKLNLYCSVNKNKSIFVVKSFAQIWGVGVYENFAPVARLDTTRMLFGYCGTKKFEDFGHEVCLLEWSTTGRNVC